MRLNCGCGINLAPEDKWINVDKFPLHPDIFVHDLEVLPWPWADDSVEEVVMNHVLEHLGQTVEAYLNIWKELYRVCMDGANVNITVPHPKHDYFINDPTHVRAVTPEGIVLLSKKECRKFKENRNSNTQLAFMLGVNFDLLECVVIKDIDVNPTYASLDKYYNNIFKEFKMVLRVVKDEKLWGFKVVQ
jgi:predicted SAM-dependent methyltransferase